jgi:ribose transport system substrate-binding protein
LWLKGAQTDDVKRDVAKDNVTKALAKIGNNPNVCLIGLWAYNPPMILEALGTGYPQVKVVGFDEDDQTLLGIESGRVHASVVQNPFMFGYKSVEVLAAEARGDQSKRVSGPIPYRVVTKNGGAAQTFDGVPVEYLKAADYRHQLAEQIQSTK